MKKLLSFVLSIVIVLTMCSVVGYAIDEPFASGVVNALDGVEFYWELSEDGGTLTIDGTGYMAEFYDTPEWLSYNFTKVVIEDGVGDIGEEAFLYAENLESVELSPTVKIIGDRAFYGCKNLKAVNYANAHYIGSMAFYGCMSYTEIEIPETVTSIDEYAFGYYCDEALDDEFAKIPDATIFSKENTEAQKYAEENEISFVNLSDYTEFFEYLLIDESINGPAHAILLSYKGCPYSDEIIIPAEIDNYKVTVLYDNLFENSDVESVYIPSSVNDISDTAFENASQLAEIICEEGGEYGSVDGILYRNGFENLIKVPEAKTEINEYPEELKYIGKNAFRNSSVKTVELPENVKYLYESAFAFSGLEKITIPESVTIVPELCFYGSENLKEVVLPKTLKTVKANAFSNCTALENIYLPYGLETVEGAAFHCAGLKSVVIPDSVKNIGNYAFGYYSADDIEFVKDEAFEVQGRGDTVAEEYAEANGFKFADVSPEQPEIWYAYTDKISVTLFWEQTDDAEGYEIYRSTGITDFEKIAEFGVDEEPVYSDLDVFNGETYTYSVVAVKNNLRSSYDKTYEIKFISLDAPELVSAQMTRKGIYVKWNTVEDAEGYILYRKTENTEWEEIADFKGNVKSFEDTTCDSGETYSYTVKAYNGEIESNCDYDGVTAMYLSIPKLKKASNATKGIKITWEKVKGANSYIIGRKTSSTGWTKIAEVDDVDSYIDKTAKAGTTYTYTVVSVFDDVKGFYDEAGITYKRLSKVTTESATNTEYGVKVVWKPVSKCSGYRVYRKTENGSYKRIATVKGATKSYYIDKKAKSGTKYIYKVVAYSGDYVSYYTEASRYYLENPELLSAKSSKKGVTAKWEVVNGASGYYVYRKEGNGSYKKLATVKGGTKYSYLDKSAKKGKTYTYKVKAYYSKTTSAYSNAKKVTDKY
ncbi:MAG: hypothetical protein E7529_01980 [Ruminococcaceae bacterium]|nr:hypothetical protein [Oscillospiraceae bacterium]